MPKAAHESAYNCHGLEKSPQSVEGCVTEENSWQNQTIMKVSIKSISVVDQGILTKQ